MQVIYFVAITRSRYTGKFCYVKQNVGILENDVERQKGRESNQRLT